MKTILSGFTACAILLSAWAYAASVVAPPPPRRGSIDTMMIMPHTGKISGSTSVRPASQSIKPKKPGYVNVGPAHTITYPPPDQVTKDSVPTMPAKCGPGQKVIGFKIGKAKTLEHWLIDDPNGEKVCTRIGCFSCSGSSYDDPWEYPAYLVCKGAQAVCAECIEGFKACMAIEGCPSEVADAALFICGELGASCKAYSVKQIEHYEFVDTKTGPDVITEITCGTLGWVDYTDPDSVQ